MEIDIEKLRVSFDWIFGTQSDGVQGESKSRLEWRRKQKLYSKENKILGSNI